MTKKKTKIPLYEQMLKELKGQIVSGVYKKGELLPSEKELVDTFGMSRITVRKTLSLLAEMGFIETNKGRGSTVLFSPEYVDSNQEFARAVEEYHRGFMASTQIRLLLEPETARQAACQATKEQIENLRKCVRIGQKKEIFEEFHRAVAAVLGNGELNKVIDQLIVLEEMDALPNAIRPENREEVRRALEEQHRKIFEAIEAGNGEFAYFYMKEHTTYIAEIYEEYFEMLRRR